MGALNEMPDESGHFGRFGGRYVAETLMPALLELQQVYAQAKQDPVFWRELEGLWHSYSGRPTPLYHARRLSQELGGAQIYLKREDLNHTGAHKINNTLGQVLLAERMGKRRVIAETGAGQHGVASATVAALKGMDCQVFMGEVDVARQALNVFRMKLLGARVVSVGSGAKTLKDATNEALRYWVAHVEDTYYIIGSVVGPHPYPMLVRDFQSVIGREVRQQIQELAGRLPDLCIAAVGGGSNAVGLFHPFRHDRQVALLGVEAAGKGIASGLHAATLSEGRPGVLHGALSYLLQDEDGQVQEAHSLSAGLDYPGVGPEHAYWKETGRAAYSAVTDDQALAAFRRLSETEGIIPALESAHALAEAIRRAPTMDRKQLIVVNLSGRGDKDVDQVYALMEGSS